MFNLLKFGKGARNGDASTKGADKKKSGDGTIQQFQAPADKSFGKKHLLLVRSEMDTQELDGFLVPHDDEYLNEYLPAHAERLMWVSGFSGSAGFAVVLKQNAAVFSDGRYTLQMRAEVDDSLFELHLTSDKSPETWLSETAPAEAKIGYDPLLFSEKSLEPFETVAEKHGITLVPVTMNPIDAAWKDRPAAPETKVEIHGLEFAGVATEEKRKLIAQALENEGADAVLLSAPASIAWTLNIRARDVHATPLPLSRALIRSDGTGTLFIGWDRIDKEVEDYLYPEVTVLPEEELGSILDTYGKKNAKIIADPATTPVAFMRRLEESGATVIRVNDPSAILRARKNPVELAGARAAHVRDGAAVTRFLHWLATEGTSGTITEISAVKKLESFRRETNHLQDISFDTISGAGPHGAIVHYRVTEGTDRPLDQNSLFLVDSGGQYKDGTTDITRTIAIGTPSDDMRRHYTLVLKGHIGLVRLKFPKGTTGHQIDAFARAPLWAAGLDYGHGTGHGVGSFLGVHEGPQRIAAAPNKVPLEPGMICSNEPGYYVEGAYGIRIENLVAVSEPTAVEGGTQDMMSFETLTMAPLDRALIDVSLLTDDERAWVDDYHAKVAEALAAHVPADVAVWLNDTTRPLIAEEQAV